MGAAVSKIHKFIVAYVDNGHKERQFDDVRAAFEFRYHYARADVFVTYEPTGLRVPVLRP